MAAKKTDNLSFEETMHELAQLVEQLEQGDLNLDKALVQFERGIHLVRAGQQKLDLAEQRVRILLEQNDTAPLVEFKMPTSAESD